MASLADEKRVKGKAAKPPISTHPAFPFIVALWFAALLGIGSLVVPVPLIERISVASGLASILPPAAPPLGFTARLLIALAFTVGGGLLGLFIARKVAAVHRAEPALRRAAKPVAETASAPAMPPPISALDELGSEGLDGRHLTGAPLRSRRALAIEEEEGPSTFLEFAPLPGRKAGAIPASMREAVHTSGLTGWNPADAPEDEAEDLGELGELDELDELDLTFVAVEESEADGTEGFAPASPVAAAPLATARQVFRFNPDATESPLVAIAWSEAEARPAALTPQDLPGTAAPVDSEEMEPEVDDETSDLVDHSQFLAPHSVFDESEAEAESPFAARATDAVYAAPAPEAVAETAAEPAFAANAAQSGLDELGLVQLAQRLGSSIERRRALLAQRAAAATKRETAILAAAAMPQASPEREPLAANPLRDEIDPVAPDEAAQAMAAWFDRPSPETEDAVALDDAAPATDALIEAPRQVFVPLDAEDEAEYEEAEDSAGDIPDTSPAPAPAFRPLDGFAHIDIGEEEEDEDLADLAASLTLNLGAAAPVADEAAAAMAPNPSASPFAAPRQTFVRIEDEPEAGAPDDAQPAVVFPAEAPAATTRLALAKGEPQPSAPLSAAEQEAQDRALREALLNLQRMSGAA